ncbi:MULTISPECIES: tripartite tricarboxylate transporter permease [unclassified Thioalkalivibrio]|uniref:tripartite tricarboxylate transporter permease n=1 Tax=unclassified Thioalkalivibrio TaxID=2621013 RepID=UPI000378E43D|nr:MULTISPECIES: tripartite tricarboxylate transporter permease [unclassified Thioalkalivibrio]
MDVLIGLAGGFAAAFTLQNLLYVLLGVTLGTFIGVLPGIGSMAAIAMLLPITFYMPPASALILLAGVYYGAEYGGSITSILLNIPGTPSSAVTCLDGHPMALSGRAGVALLITAVASLVGSSVAIFFLTFAAPALGRLVLNFGPAEYFAVILFGLVATSTITNGSTAKSLAMVAVGVLLGLIGMDQNSAVARFTFGIPELFDGIDLIVLAMGLFGISEIMRSMVMRSGHLATAQVSLKSMIPTREDLRASGFPMVRGTAVGSFLGTLPGAGQTIASFVAYAVEKRVSRTRERFGKGAIEGISAPESANNAAALTAFIPTLSMGIPGSATMALMLGALMIHGITPGPNFVTQNSDMFWTLIASFWIGSFLLILLNIPLIGLWVRILKIPYQLLFPMIIVLLCIGVYSVNNSPFDVGLALMLGVIAVFLRSYGFEMAPVLIGFILGPMLERYFRRSIQLGRGEAEYFVSSGISMFFLAATVLLLLMAVVAGVRSVLRGRTESSAIHSLRS